MSPIRVNPYPSYDVRKIIECLKHPSDDLINVYAHRALRLIEGSTENSYSAISAAATAGYEGIEIDVRLTADHQVVILHDEGLGRSTDVEPPAGQEVFNPFTGQGHSPLVAETNWFGDMEHYRLRDVNGNVTSEHPIRLQDVLAFIRDEGINMVVQLDIKDARAMELAFEIIKGFSNAAGIPAIEWCVWKCSAPSFPTPDTWEAQDWVQKAVESGHKVQYISLYPADLDPAFDVMSSNKAWMKKDYLLNFEIHIQRIGGPLQPALDFVKCRDCLRSVCTWRISGDLPRSYYTGDNCITWDDSKFRKDILKCGPSVPIQFDEWRGVKAVGGKLGYPPSNEFFDGRTDLSFLLQQGFNSVVADPFDDVHELLRKLRRRNVNRMMQS